MKVTHKLLLFILALFLLQLIVFWPSFRLSLWGDDWLAFWRYSRILDIEPSYGYNQGFTHISYFLTPYGPQDINMGLLQKLLSYNPSPYYVVSLIFRFLLTVAMFLAGYGLTKKLFAAFATSAFIAITPIGLDTTNWVFNMTSYIGLAFAVIFLYFYLKSFQIYTFKYVVISYISLFFAIVIVPIRMHGYLPFVFATEFFSLFTSNNKGRDFYRSLMRIALLILVTLVIKNIGTSFANPNESVSRVKNGIHIIDQMVNSESKKEVLLYPFANYGNMLFPEMYWGKVTHIINIPLLGRARPFFVVSGTLFLLYLFVIFNSIKRNPGRRNQAFSGFVLLGVFVNTIVWIFYKASPLTFASISLFGSTLVGIYVFAYLLGLLLLHVAPKDENLLVFTATVWPFAFILLPWFTSPYSVFNIEHRYLIPSAIGVSLTILVFAIMIANKKLLFALCLLILILHGFATKGYLDEQVKRRSMRVSNKVWEVLNKRLPGADDHAYYVAYFEGDNSNGHVVHNNAFFGFPPRRSLEEQIYNQYDIPLAITTYDELVAMVTYGGSLTAHAKKEEPVPIERVYAFRILGSTLEELKVEDITDRTRDELRNKIAEYKKQ